MHNVVRELGEKLSGLKYNAPVMPKGMKSKDMYHIYACPELGLQNIAMRQIPCFCNACRAQIKLPWQSNIEPEKQPRFQTVIQCKYNSVLDGANRWYFPQLQQKTMKEKGHHKFMDEEADLMRKDVWDHLTAVVSAEIVALGHVVKFSIMKNAQH